MVEGEALKAKSLKWKKIFLLKFDEKNTLKKFFSLERKIHNFDIKKMPSKEKNMERKAELHRVENQLE